MRQKEYEVTRSLRLFCLLILTFAFAASDVFIPVVNGSGFAVAQEVRQKKRGFFQRLFGREKTVRRSQKTKRTKSRSKTNSTAAARRRAAELRRKATAALPKITEANRIVVMGDLTANSIAQGLINTYKRTPSVEISARVQDDISITGDGFYPWLDASDFTFLGDRVKAVVVALGLYDRFTFVTPQERIAFGTPKWERNYRRRLVDITAQLQLLGVPVIWVLPPPVIDNENTDKSILVGAIQKGALSTTSFKIIDVASGFTNQEGKFRLKGASITGSRVMLRQHDGIGFTRKGANKLAYYVRREIDTILDESISPVFRLEGNQPRKRNAQQVINLTRPALRQNASLSGGNGRISAFYRDGRARNYFIGGKALNAPTGRADNFSWGDTAKDKAAALKTAAQSPTIRW